jgi:hypothetical protein
MPYLIDRPQKRSPLTRRALAAIVAIAATGMSAAPAMAASSGLTPSSCTNPLLSQPFASFGDSNYYTLMPGESANDFTGTGWTLSGGASVVKTTLADGATGRVLDLPSGSEATSPLMCVNIAMPTARTMIRNVVGSEGVFFYVAYEGTNTWGNPQNTGQVHGQQTAWTLSDPVNLQPSNLPGWQIAQFTFVAGGNPQNPSDFQIYNTYVDPYAK